MNCIIGIAKEPKSIGRNAQIKMYPEWPVLGQVKTL